MVTNLPNTSLAKKALLENIALRTNWIKTIEKVINTLNLDKIGNHVKFKKATKLSLENGFKNGGKRHLMTQAYLDFYSTGKLNRNLEWKTTSKSQAFSREDI